ncbi:uncharacterized protein LOC115402945 isoform X2 [Salarias fasciatus]|uniref:uncharacterized protein LOC115402945 isoform X2 n=1 Tax=Salarias fasciatus TaxID=181472 RepID=UPI001176BE0A|nr:uncharacterized protein LOC115402945 isoform X2 [Salarias fasciatus]
MEEVLKYLSINWTLIFCLLNMFSSAEGSQISKTVGSPVSLHCNASTSKFIQLTWNMNGVYLFSYSSGGELHYSPEAAALNLNVSTSASRLYALLIDKAQKHHTGNYSCESTTVAGIFSQNWELIVTEREEKKLNVLMISVGTTVVCVCFLIFIFTWIFLRTVCKKDKEITINPIQEMQQTEDIYENCLKIEQRNKKHSRGDKP